MSPSEPFDAAAQSWADREATSAIAVRRGPAPIVPRDSIAGRSLTAVVAIMTFLAALATGARAIGVATGRSAAADLRAAGAHAVLDDLTSTSQVVAAVLRPDHAGEAERRVTSAGA